MSAKMQPLKREFLHNGQVLPDPNPEMEVQEVLDFYANSYPELTSAHAVENEPTAESIQYEFVVSKGTKG